MGRRNPKSRPSFFKVLINQDFNRRLRLPPSFVKKWGAILPQSLAQLRTSSGTTWDVKLEKQEDQNYYFSGGWSKFCEDIGLVIGEFVVFWYNGRAIFDVSVYGISACEKEITAINNNPVGDSDLDEAVNRAPVAEDLDVKVKGEDEDWADPQDESVAGKFECYSRILDRRNSCTLGISKAFMMSAGIAGDRMIHLQDSRSRLWPVQIESLPRKNGGCRFALTAGWNDFLVGNKAAPGSTVLLKCEEPGGSLVKAKVLNNNGTNGRKLFKPRRREGRPSKLCMPHALNALPCKEECVYF